MFLMPHRGLAQGWAQPGLGHWGKAGCRPRPESHLRVLLLLGPVGRAQGVLGVFMLKAFASFQIPPLAASSGSSLGHVEQAEEGRGHAALASTAEVRGAESRPGEDAAANSVLVSPHGWDIIPGQRWPWGAAQSLLHFPGVGVGLGGLLLVWFV